MNAEQKQRAKDALTNCQASDMAALLQEMIATHEPKPVARVTGYYAGYLSIATVDGRVLPAGTALYAAPPHQSEHHLEMVNTPAPSVPDGWRGLTDVEWMNIVNFDRAYSSYDKEEAVHEAVKRTEAKLKELNAAPTPAELLKTTNSVQISSSQVEAPSVPDEQLQAAFDRGFKAGNEQGIAQQIEIHKLHDLLAAPTQAEAPADVVRDAERYRWLRNWTRRAYGIDSNPAFILPHVPIPTGPDQNIMRGSLAQHLDNAIDAAIERDKKGDQS